MGQTTRLGAWRWGRTDSANLTDEKLGRIPPKQTRERGPVDSHGQTARGAGTCMNVPQQEKTFPACRKQVCQGIRSSQIHRDGDLKSAIPTTICGSALWYSAEEAISGARGMEGAADNTSVPRNPLLPVWIGNAHLHVAPRLESRTVCTLLSPSYSSTLFLAKQGLKLKAPCPKPKHLL